VVDPTATRCPSYGGQQAQATASITQDVYMGRQAANPAAARALEQAFEDPDLA
jgi:hypothetical protein